jgi:hypothetical protein
MKKDQDKKIFKILSSLNLRIVIPRPEAEAKTEVGNDHIKYSISLF